MKTIACLAAILAQLLMYSPLFGGEPVAYANYAHLLDTYVNETGVDYAKWHADKRAIAELDKIVHAFSSVEPADLNAAEQKAFYINLYNALMLQTVLQHYPIESVADILPDLGVFKQKLLNMGDTKVSLDNIEKRWLLQRFPDARIHFAVNCASRSCPPLATQPFRAAHLEEQLEAQTRAFARSDRAVVIDDEHQILEFSQLFQWYTDDFGSAGPAAYLNSYRSTPLPRNYTTAWMPYDWSLNRAQ